MAVILAGGEGERLSILSQERAKPAVPFGGKYRIIDFTLSNCVNSDIDDVVVLTQYNPRSLNDHIGLGRPWDLDRNRGGVKLLQPYIERGKVAEWYRGTADAVLRNINVIEHDPADIILVLAGDHIYKMDYAPFVAAHRRHRADVTIAVRRVPLAEATRMGILALDENDRVTEWQEKPKQPKSDLASMGVYVFSKKTLRRWLSEDRVDFGANVIPAMLEAGARVFGYRYNGYWQDVGTIQSYWEANMRAPRRRPGPRPVRQGLGHPHPLRGTRAGQGRPDGAGPQEPDQPRLRHRRDGRQLDPVAGRPGRRRRGRARLDRHVRLGRSARARSSIGRSSTRRSSSARAPSSATGRTTTGRTSRSPAASTPASPSSASARSSLAASGSGATSRSPPMSARPISPGASCAAASRSSGSVPPARAARPATSTEPAKETVAVERRCRRARGRRRARRSSRRADAREVAPGDLG